MRGFCRRGQLSPPDSRGLVVRPLGSCLEDTVYVGRIDRGLGGGIGVKAGILIKKGGIWWSNGMVLQSNDRCGYWPRDYLWGNRIAGMGFRVPRRLEDEIGGL